MKSSSLVQKLAALGLCAGAASAPLCAQEFEPSPNPLTTVVPLSVASGSTSTVNFDNYTGTSIGSLQVSTGTAGYVETSRDPSSGTWWKGVDTGTSTVVGWRAYHSPVGGVNVNDYSFGILENGNNAGEFGDTRLYIAVKNTGAAAVSRFIVSWDLKQARDGNRTNDMALKYNNSGTSGFSDQPQLGYAAAPKATGSGALDVNDPANRVHQSNLCLLTVGGTLTPLAINSTGYFRWQYGNVTSSGSRDGLSIDNIEFTPLPAGTDIVWTGSTSGNWFGASNWSGTTWSGTTFNAVFSNASSPNKTITVDAPASAIDLSYRTNGYNVIGASALTVNGVVDVATSVTGTLAGNVASTTGFVKTGTGTLMLGGTNSFTGNAFVYSGTVKSIANNVIPAGNSLRVEGVYDLNGFDLAVNGIVSNAGSVNLGTNSDLTLAITSDAQLKGALTSTGTAGSVVVSGSGGVQHFKTTTKTYSVPTTVSNGTLDVSEKGYMPNTPSITVTGPVVTGTNDTPPAGAAQGTLSLSNDSQNPETYAFASAGTIKLNGGILLADKTDFTGSTRGITLTNAVQLINSSTAATDYGSDNRITTSGTGTHLHLTGVLSSTNTTPNTVSTWRKQGAGTLYLDNAVNTFNGILNLNNGVIVSSGTQSLGSDAFLLFGDSDQAGRKLLVNQTVTVGGLEGNVAENVGSGTLPGTPKDYAEIVIASGKTFSVAQHAVVSGTTETKPSYQGDITGSGTLAKTGFGAIRMTRYLKTYPGRVVVNQGVMQMSSDGQFTSAAGYTVNAGGQIRLSTGGTVQPNPLSGVGASNPGFYNLGSAVLTLSSTSRALGGGIIANSGFGELGGLRFDPDSSMLEKFAILASNVAISGASDIHVNGLASVLTMTGTLTGSAALIRTGGGTVDFTGGTVSGYTGNMELVNGTTKLANGQAFGGSITVDGGVDAPVLDFAGSASITGAGGLFVDDGGVLSVRPGNTVSATGPIDMSTGGWVVDCNGFSTPGTYTILSGGASTALNTTGTVRNIGAHTGSLSQVGNDIRLTINP